MRRFAGKGLAGFLQKPYRAGTLVETIQRIVSGPGITIIRRKLLSKPRLRGITPSRSFHPERQVHIPYGSGSRG